MHRSFLTYKNGANVASAVKRKANRNGKHQQHFSIYCQPMKIRKQSVQVQVLHGCVHDVFPWHSTLTFLIKLFSYLSIVLWLSNITSPRQCWNCPFRSEETWGTGSQQNARDAETLGDLQQDPGDHRSDLPDAFCSGSTRQCQTPRDYIQEERATQPWRRVAPSWDQRHQSSWG